jgi:signal transduction histidine kinase
MVNELWFSASTNVKNLIGKDLVTDQYTAVFELVKNSYDADATTVKIELQNLDNGNGLLIIEDNGSGMNLKDIQKKWMVIGTDSKKDKLFSEVYSRPLNGDKGIGRFSVDRLGQTLLLESVYKGSNSKIEMEFDWSKFEGEYRNLEDIKIPYSISLSPTKNSGVRLEIADLRDSWDGNSVEKLINNLRQFKSPFAINDNFSITISVPEYGINNFEIEPYNLEEISSFWVDAEIPVENTDVINIKVVRDGIKYEEEYMNTYNFGPVKSKLYFFGSGDKVRFKHKMKTTVKDFGNVRLYRDNFRIHPYGESYNDWLDLDRRKAQGYSRFFGSRDIIGYVQIYKEYNTGIDAPTNRQGLIESKATDELRQFIINFPIKKLEQFFFKASKNETFDKSQKEVKNAVSELRKVTKEIRKSSPETAKILRGITGVVEKSQRDQSKYVENQKELLEVYKRVASKEVLLHQIIHQALIKIEKVITASHAGKNKLENIETTSDRLRITLGKSFNNIDRLTLNAKNYLKKARDHLIRKRKNELINLNSFITNQISTFFEVLSEEKIANEIDISENMNIKIDKSDLETIIDNFMSNSIKSLKKKSESNKWISIKAVETNNFITLVFKDNGVGIPSNLRDRIFDPFFSSTNSSGMGLSIVDEIIKEHGGQLNLAINNNVGAEFQIKFRK